MDHETPMFGVELKNIWVATNYIDKALDTSGGGYVDKAPLKEINGFS